MAAQARLSLPHYWKSHDTLTFVMLNVQLFGHACNVPVSYKANRDRNQLGGEARQWINS